MRQPLRHFTQPQVLHSSHILAQLIFCRTISAGLRRCCCAIAAILIRPPLRAPLNPARGIGGGEAIGVQCCGTAAANSLATDAITAPHWKIRETQQWGLLRLLQATCAILMVIFPSR